MQHDQQVSMIVDELVEQGLIDGQHLQLKKMKGTTEGVVYILSEQGIPKFTLKMECREQIRLAKIVLETYSHSKLLPDVHYTNANQTCMLYTYIDGVTHIERGLKRNWLITVVDELINLYQPYAEADIWGRIECPHSSWRQFCEIGIDDARTNVGNVLDTADYELMKSFCEDVLQAIGESPDRFLLHGDTGVHNFVYKDSLIRGVIDPSPMAGPILYDFLYAYCSSPDDLTVDTLLEAYQHLRIQSVEQSILLKEAMIQLYIRIGLSIKHHPHDLHAYLAAWEYWKRISKNIQLGLELTTAYLPELKHPYTDGLHVKLSSTVSLGMLVHEKIENNDNENTLEDNNMEAYSLHEMVVHQTKLAIQIAETIGHTLDFSSESIHRVEDILDNYANDYASHDDMIKPLDREVWSIAAIWGTYVGEVMRMELGERCSWEAVEGGYLLDAQGAKANPILKAFKRIVNGPEDNIVSFYDIIGEKMREHIQKGQEI